MSMKVTKEQFIGVTYEELLALNDELLAYNDELLALMRLKALAVMGELQEENERLKADNAKLRELVKALLTCATDGDCDECRLNGATPWHVGKAQLCDGVWDRVRELGVEVD